MVTGDSTFYTRLLGRFYDGAEALPVQGFKGVDTDAWNRARSIVQAAGRGHLLVLFWLRGIVRIDAASERRNARVVYSHRYSASDDATSQARVHASMDQMVRYIEDFSDVDGTRVINVTSTDVEPFDEQWTDVAIDFIIQTPRSL